MRIGYVSLAIVAVMSAASLPAAAEESGHWHGLSALVITDKKAAKVEDRADHMVTVTEYDGAVYNGDGKPFLDRARYQVVGFGDTGVTRGGYKTFTEADGSKVFGKYTVTEVKMPDVRGTFEFTGGTGKYEGITGNGTFHDVLRRHGTNLLVITRFRPR